MNISEFLQDVTLVQSPIGNRPLHQFNDPFYTTRPTGFKEEKVR